jgi:hypothetical protein
MHFKKLIIMIICSSLFYSQESPEKDKRIGLETKQEMERWNEKFNKFSIGLGFGLSNPINRPLVNSPSVLNGFHFGLNLNNIFNLEVKKKQYKINLNLTAEYMGWLKPINTWLVINSMYYEIINIGLGLGISNIIYENSFSEIAPGIIFSLHTPIPINFHNDRHFLIGLTLSSIFSKFNNLNFQGTAESVEYYLILKEQQIITSNVYIKYHFNFN